MTNINTLDIDSTIVLNKIDELTVKLRAAQQSETNITKGQLIVEANNFLSTLFKDLSKPIFSPTKVTRDSKPDIVKYNNDFGSIRADLNILFKELENLEKVIIGNYNFITSDAGRLTARLKTIFSLLGDYIFFAKDPLRETIYFTDSFSNLNRIENNSALLNNPQCNVNASEGIVTLPIDKTQQSAVSITDVPIINSQSNGTPGNNFESVVNKRSDISVINDNNPDTWFEYEKVVDLNLPGLEPLILDLTLNVGTPEIINSITINPNNFGARTQVIISDILTSLDGQLYTSIKDDLPVADFETEDEENIFVLAPSSSKFAGQGIFTFTPRNVKYVRVSLKQTTPYSIVDVYGATKLRYAIGIRDINIQKLFFQETGELISTEYTTSIPVKKLSLVTHQNPTSTSALAGIQHFLSPDNGISWHEITPLDFDGNDQTIPKILNFNTADENSITTSTPVTGLRYKVLFRRFNDFFTTDTAPIKKRTEVASELHSSPVSSPFLISLNKKPVPNTLMILDPGYGSRGLNSKRYRTGTGIADTHLIHLPFENIQKNLSKSTSVPYEITETAPEVIRVNGEEWARGTLTGASATDKIYQVNYTTGVVKFGNGTAGKAPPAGASIDVMFSPERIFPSGDKKHIATLNFGTTNDKREALIKSFGVTTTHSEVLNKGSKIHKLQYKNIAYAIFSNSTVFAGLQVFVDGVSELVNTGEYSIDSINGIVYSFDSTSSIQDTTITYGYTPEKILSENEWEYITGNNKIGVSILPSAFETLQITGEDIVSGVRHISLSKLGIVQGTLSFTGGIAATVFRLEVPFINGRTELNNFIRTSEDVSELDAGSNSFVTRISMITSNAYSVNFSNTSIFATEVANVGDVNSNGEYHINRETSTVTVYTDTAQIDTGSITYYYRGNATLNSGLYSVNYKTGEIYVVLATGSDITCNYQYTHYEMSYPIAKIVDKSQFVYNTDTNSISLKDIEIMRRRDTVEAGRNDSGFYQVLFDAIVEERENIQGLRDFFSPILKDYSLQIITEDKLIL